MAVFGFCPPPPHYGAPPQPQMGNPGRWTCNLLRKFHLHKLAFLHDLYPLQTHILTRSPTA